MERVSEQPCNSYTYQVSRHSAEMLNNLNQQRKNGGRFCDVLLRVGEESFPAHRAVLAACSEYFESVFSSQGEAGEAGESKELEMHTISAKVFRDILDFAYTSRIVVRLESFPELMTAAKFLLMRSIIEICQEVIKQSNVQILVPPARGDMMLFRPGGVGDLGFSLDMANGLGLGTSGGQAADGDISRVSGPLAASSGPPGFPMLQTVDRLPVTPPGMQPQLVAGPFQSMSGIGPSITGKRGRGRPRKAPVDCLMIGGPSSLRETGVFPCGLCGKIFTDANRLRQHEAQHGVTSLQLGFQEAEQQRLGENRAPDGPDTPRKRGRVRKQVGCEVCGKVFRDVYHLNRHKLSHSGEKPYACPVCGLRFKRKDRMSYHVRSHDGSVGKPYVCISCGKGFSRPDHLNGHIKQVHTSERPHKCQTCNASFATRDRLRSHLACHEDKVPCQVCGKYLRAAYMVDHLKKHSEGPSNFCSICNRGFSTASYLRVHVKTHHGAPMLNSRLSENQEPIPNGGAAFHSDRTYGMSDGEKCPHQEQHDNSDSFGEFSDTSDLHSPTKQNENGPFSCDPVVNPKSDRDLEAERKYSCQDCGSFFRSKTYLTKHVQKVHLRPLPGPLGDLGPSLGTPFSPQQNMSLLESFGFQIVQSAFASTLADSEVGQSAMNAEEK
ncbi:POZ-, AT hook-, and zinc finger-containing protein 1 [Latimeria chalumnae]|uniref:POZ-, AT hook-, and zinc finger-containing protein 1 n=1 Tax=Latimeria chalumnae TaxID=7897 RepID=UPI0003C1741C